MVVAVKVASVMPSPPFLKMVTAIMIAAAMVATKLSSRSEQLPAMSLTLSPMKSAMTFGTRESSSGRSLRIFARMSAEMSAALV